jgi:putative endonuclease
MGLFKNTQGKIGEEFAVSFLQRKGFIIIDRNFRIRGGEIDVIAIDPSEGKGKEALVFIEVKTRSSDEYGDPLEAIGYYKLKALIKTSQFYKMKNAHLPDLMRIDAVSVILDENGFLLKIELVKNIS